MFYRLLLHLHVHQCTNKVRRYSLVFNLLKYFLSNELIQISRGLEIVSVISKIINYVNGRSNILPC